MIHGSCLCQRVRYELDGSFTDVCNCHCGICQKIHGAAFGSYGAVQRTNFRWTSGEELIRTYRSSEEAQRTFCGNCGSIFQTLYENAPEYFYLTLASVDGDPGCRPGYHVFVGSKASWFEITDELPQNDTWSTAPPGTG